MADPKKAKKNKERLAMTGNNAAAAAGLTDPATVAAE
jgi:hypothetical protein